MSVLCTNFDLGKFATNPYSAARWAPHWFEGPSIRELAPWRWATRNKQVRNSVTDYVELYMDALLHLHRMKREGFFDGRDVAFLCWCSLAQQKKKGRDTLMCHTVLIAEVLARILDAPVFVDEERALHTAKGLEIRTEFSHVWKETKLYRVLGK